MPRLFTAIALPDEVKAPLLRCQGGVDGARWLGAEQLHLTLRFIGEVSGHMAEDIAHALNGLGFAPFTLELDGFGIFGKIRNPRALWVGVKDPAPLSHLHDKIERALVSLGLPPEGRRFSPHVTIARFRKAKIRGLDRFLEGHSPLVPAIQVAQFALFESRLGNGGASYRIVAEYPEDQNP